MLLGAFTIALLDTFLLGEFLSGRNSPIVLMFAFCAALLTTIKAVQHWKGATLPNREQRNPWHVAECYSFLISNIAALLATLILHPEIDGPLYCGMGFLFAVPAAMHGTIEYVRNIRDPY